MNIARVCLCLVLLSGIAFSPTSWPRPLPHAALSSQASLAGDLLAQAPLTFIENRGQVGAAARYYIQGRNCTLYFTSSGVIFRLAGNFAPGAVASVLSVEFVGANPAARPEGVERADMTVNYFTGSPDRWLTGLPAYSAVIYRDLWPGIDLEWRGASGRLKQVFRVQAGADPRRIGLTYRGVLALAIESDGGLSVTTAAGAFGDERPYAWQELDGAPAEVPVAYRFIDAEDDAWSYGFEVGAYDPARLLLLDPELLLYAGYVGGEGDDEAAAVAVDSAGATYIVGSTASAEASFPDGDGIGALPGPDRTFNGEQDAFIAKIRPDGRGFAYVGYIGGTGSEFGLGVAVDAAGNAYVTGETASDEGSFPVGSGFGALPGPDRTFNGGKEAYVVQVKPDGSGLGWATYVGGDEDEAGVAIAVDVGGAVHVAGATESGEETFPDGDGIGALAGPDRSFNGARDAFVVAIGSALPQQPVYLPLVRHG